MDPQVWILMACFNEPKILPQKSELISTGLSIAIPKNTKYKLDQDQGLAAKSNVSVLIHLEQSIVTIEEK